MSWIKIVAPMFLAAVMVWQPDASRGQLFPFGDKTPPPESTRAKFDDACALLATTAVADLYNAQEEQKLLADCARHPDPSVCENTKQFIEEHHSHAMPELVCGASGNVSKSATDENVSRSTTDKEGRHGMFPYDKLPPADPATRFDDACATIAALIGTPFLPKPEEFAICAKHPNHDVCQKTKKYIEEKAHRSVPELVCGG
jgi:hypothetical protein